MEFIRTKVGISFGLDHLNTRFELFENQINLAWAVIKNSLYVQTIGMLPSSTVLSSIILPYFTQSDVHQPFNR
jgi:hypothetical protein